MEPDAAAASVAEQVRGAWTDLLAAAAQAGYAGWELIRPPAAAEELAKAEAAVGRAFPAELAALYQVSDGQVDWIDLTDPDAPPRQRGRHVCSLFGAGWTFNDLARLRSEYQTWAGIRAQYTSAEQADSFDGAIEVRGGDPVRPVYTSADWIPFATDGGGNSLAADLDPLPGGQAGQVIVIGPDEDLRRVVAPGIRALLELCAGRLRDPSLVLDVEDDGVALYPLEDLVPPERPPGGPRQLRGVLADRSGSLVDVVRAAGEVLGRHCERIGLGHGRPLHYEVERVEADSHQRSPEAVLLRAQHRGQRRGRVVAVHRPRSSPWRLVRRLAGQPARGRSAAARQAN